MTKTAATGRPERGRMSRRLDKIRAGRDLYFNAARAMQKRRQARGLEKRDDIRQMEDDKSGR